MIDLQDILGRFKYAESRWHLGDKDQAWGALVFGLPPIVKHLELKVRRKKVIEVISVSKRVKNHQGALDKYGDLIIKKAIKFKFDPALILGICWAESTFYAHSTRFEPNWCYKYVWKRKGPPLIEKSPYNKFYEKEITLEEWFDQHPRRTWEKVSGRDYSQWAQIRIASSYSLMQLLYPSAVMEGFKGTPEDLYDPNTGLEYSLKHLNRKRRRYPKKTDFIAAYNSGSVSQKDDGTYRNQYYVNKVLKAQKKFQRLL